ncbi:hypothetical protein SK128_020877 [Halocaridina rubra]|uniref:C2H2-type domain-containing protein n=1 Tax=Halocaridina rubra TaxID=373956 RepID=A0AAN9A287_HALRR
MGEFVIECTLCGLSFTSEREYDSHPCLEDDVKVPFKIKMEQDDEEAELEQEVQNALEQSTINLKEEPMTFKEEPSDAESEDLDPLGIMKDDPADEDYVKEELPDDLSDESMPAEPSKSVPVETAAKNDSVPRLKQCNVCGKRFFRVEDFIDHDLNAHKAPRPYECKVCKKRFTQKHYVALHMRVHTGERPYKCELCSNTYIHKTSYTIHMRIHNNERPYRCVICGKRCYDKSGLTSHMRSHTKETPYQCEVCGRRFTHSKSLLVHRRNHTGEKPYKCRYCGKDFRHWHKHKIHIRLHTGERPYKCKVCGKGFPRNDEVKRHMRSHVGIKSFKCSICSVYCATQASITGHIDLHHADLKPNNPLAPEKTVVKNSNSGILGTKAPQPRTIYKPINDIASSFAVTSMSQTSSTKDSDVDNEEKTTSLSFKEYMDQQEKILSEKGLIVRTSKSNTATTNSNANKEKIILPKNLVTPTTTGKPLVILPQSMPSGGNIQLVLPRSVPAQTQTQTITTSQVSTTTPQLILNQSSVVLPQQPQAASGQNVGNQQLILLTPSGRPQTNVAMSQPLLLLCSSGTGSGQRLILLPQQTTRPEIVGGQTMLMSRNMIGVANATPASAATNAPLQIKQEVTDPSPSTSQVNILPAVIKQENSNGLAVGTVIKQEPEETFLEFANTLSNTEIKIEPLDIYDWVADNLYAFGELLSIREGKVILELDCLLEKRSYIWSAICNDTLFGYTKNTLPKDWKKYNCFEAIVQKIINATTVIKGNCDYCVRKDK